MSAFGIPKGYEPLAAVLVQAIQQAAYGKGKERHQIGDTPFDRQPILEIGRMVGYQGDLFQAIKKMQEATRLAPDAAVREILGAINYAAAAVMLIQEQNPHQPVNSEPMEADQGEDPLDALRAALRASGFVEMTEEEAEAEGLNTLFGVAMRQERQESQTRPQTSLDSLLDGLRRAGIKFDPNEDNAVDGDSCPCPACNTRRSIFGADPAADERKSMG